MLLWDRKWLSLAGWGCLLCPAAGCGTQGGLAELDLPEQGLETQGRGRGLVARLKWGEIRAGLPSKVQGKAEL